MEESCYITYNQLLVRNEGKRELRLQLKVYILQGSQLGIPQFVIQQLLVVYSQPTCVTVSLFPMLTIITTIP